MSNHLDTIEVKAILEEGMSVVDEKQRPVLQIALLATVYFEDPYKQEAREAVVACCEDYLRRCGEHLRWALHPYTDRMQPYGQAEGSNPRGWLLDLEEDDSFSVLCHGEDDKKGASSFQLYTFGGQRRPFMEFGHFQVVFPMRWFSDHPGSLPEVLLEICHKLKPVSGYGGIGLIASPYYVVRQHLNPSIDAIAQRFPGLEFDDPASHHIWLPTGREGRKDGIKGANWLTILSDRYLDELGGVSTVQADLSVLDRRFVLHRFDGGAMIQAGDHPEIGDARRNIWPELYVKLAKYLKPVRIARFGTGPRPDTKPDFDSEAWLRRFDDR